MPMGVASISFTWAMPSASMNFTCSGSLPPPTFAASAGIRLSSTIVVLPEPDTPVTTESRPLGNATDSGCTVWISEVSMRIVPRAKSSSSFARLRSTPR